MAEYIPAQDTLLPPEASCVVLERLELSTSVVEVREYHSETAGTAILSSSKCFFDLALSPRQADTLGHYQNYPGAKSTRLGPLVFIPPFRPLKIEWQAGQHRSLYCGFTGNRPEDDDYVAVELEAGLDIRNAFVREAMQRLATEMLCPGGYQSTQLMTALWTTSCVELGRYLRELAKGNNHDENSLSMDLLEQINLRLQEAGKPPTLTDVAAMCGLSPRHFSRLFHATTGKSYSAYLLDKRIEKAKRLLASSQKSMKQISWLCGFETQAAFTAKFRQQVGVPPSEYRSAITSLVVIPR